jgi:hypothetical protein
MPNNLKVSVSDFPAWERGSRLTLGPCARRHHSQKDRRILGVISRGGYEYLLHATKGIRVQRKPGDGERMGAFLASIPNPVRQPPRYAATVAQKDYLRGGNFMKKGD